jgi:hypothetical protein
MTWDSQPSPGEARQQWHTDAAARDAAYLAQGPADDTEGPGPTTLLGELAHRQGAPTGVRGESAWGTDQPAGERPPGRLPQPREGTTGTDRTGDPLVSLEDDALPTRFALATMAYHLSRATMVGSPAPIVARMADRIHAPRPGDLVVEAGRTMRALRNRRDDQDWYRGFGYLVDHRREWSHTDEEWAADVAAGEWRPDERPSEDVWYVQYGPAPADVCRWQDADFVTIPIGDEDFAVPAGQTGPDGVTTFTRGSLLGGLTDSGFTLRTPTKES